MREIEFITGHVIYNPAYTYKFQLKTTIVTTSIQIKFLFGDSNYHVDDHKDTDIDRTSNKGQLVNYFGKIFKISWGLV